MQNPYLPDIIGGVIQRVSAAFQARGVDPFAVFFDKGIYTQVTKNVFLNNPGNFPLVWMVMPFTVKRDDVTIYGTANIDLIIAMPTDAQYTQQQREDNSFFPRLIPIYDVLIEEINRERSFRIAANVNHDCEILPYWGGGDVNGADNDNIFKNKIDAIRIKNLKLDIRKTVNPCNYPLNMNTNYPSKP